MKKRNSILALSIVSLTFEIVFIVLFIIDAYVLKTAKSHNIIDLFKIDLVNAFSFTNVFVSIATIAVLALGVIGIILYIIFGIKRRRISCVFGGLLLAVSTLLTGLYLPFLLNQCVQAGVLYFGLFADIAILELIAGGCIALAYLLTISLLIVDIATGKKNKFAPIRNAYYQPLENKKEEKEEVQEEVQEDDEEEVVEKQEEEEKEDIVLEEEENEKSEQEIKEEKAKEEIKGEPKEEKEKRATQTIRSTQTIRGTQTLRATQSVRGTQTIMLTNEEGKTYAKAFHVSRREDLNKWQVKATGSNKALKLFNTQKEAIDYANEIAKTQNVSVRVHSKSGKIRKHRS